MELLIATGESRAIVVCHCGRCDGWLVVSGGRGVACAALVVIRAQAVPTGGSAGADLVAGMSLTEVSLCLYELGAVVCAWRRLVGRGRDWPCGLMREGWCVSAAGACLAV